MLLGILICSEYEIELIDLRTIAVMSYVFVKREEVLSQFPDGYYVVKKARRGFFHQQMLTPQQVTDFVSRQIMDKQE